MKVTPLPGSIPQNRSNLTKVPQIRGDFARMLEGRLSGWIGQPGTERFENLKSMLGNKVSQGENGSVTIKIDSLPIETKAELEKLQRAAENIEALFVKQLLGKMRETSFIGKAPDQMDSFAKDLMDQAVAEQASKSGSQIGIAQMVFLESAPNIVRAGLNKKQI